ncbi:MAG: hypothetical protein U0670_18540 [Anaerolineae bacterium]
MTPANAALDPRALDSLILQGADVTPDALKAALKDLSQRESLDIEDSQNLTNLTLKRGMEYALENRDMEVALLIARLMDTYPALDTRLWEWMYLEMGKHPDAVYAFVRARVAAELDPRWLPRLQAAANTSLQVAIADGDWLTVISWLKLIGREPSAYGLGDTLIRGIRLAQPRAHDEPDLAVALVVLSAKRNQACLETLLEDPELLAALPDDNLRAALADHDGDAVALLNVYGADLFLVALARASNARHNALITPAAVEQLWALLSAVSGTGFHVSGEYTPDAVLSTLIDTGVSWLAPETLITLLRLALADRRDDVFHRMAHTLKDHPGLLDLMTAALYRSGRSISDVLAVISQMVANTDVSAQDAVDIFVALMRTWEWNKATVLMMAQLARAIQFHPELSVEADTLWHMLDAAAESKEDLIARVVAKRLTLFLETLDDEAALMEGLSHLYLKTGWAVTTRGHVVNWWRGYARAQNGARLTRLDKALDGKKGLDEIRDILGTVIALRRLVGKRSMEEFADAVMAAYDLLEALASAFEPSAKGTARFDSDTVRAEIDVRGEELTPHGRKILANNLKELAMLIAALGDNRSKPGLVRRGDDLDRALMTGEQEPDGAVDALKWMSGYLSGAHEDNDAEEP